MTRQALFLLAVVGCAACPSTSMYRTADPVNKGQWRLGAGVDVGLITDTEQESVLPTGSIELTVRRGMSDNLDLGLKLYTAGLEANGTWRVYRGVWSFAIAPQITVLREPESPASSLAFHLFTGVTGIASRPLWKNWKVGTGPIVGYGLYQPETGGIAHGGWLGGFVHLERVFGSWRILPEMGAYKVIVGEVPVKGHAFRMGASLQYDL